MSKIGIYFKNLWNALIGRSSSNFSKDFIDDPDGKVGVCMGLTEQRMEYLHEYVKDNEECAKSTTGVMKILSKQAKNTNEFAYICFCVGKLVGQSVGKLEAFSDFALAKIKHTGHLFGDSVKNPNLSDEEKAANLEKLKDLLDKLKRKRDEEE